jgi:hypothetical protein
MAGPSITISPSKSRRALLAGALGGLGAVAATAIGRVSPVRAEGEAIVVGGEYQTATSVTTITNQANGAVVFRALSTSDGTGVVGTTNSGSGVIGISSSGRGVWGDSSSGTAVRGTVGTGGTGVHGQTSGHHTSTAVRGIAKPEGVAVKAETQNGIAVWAQATGGYALAVEGRAVFSQRGRATFSAGQASRTISASLPFLATSMVLATIQGNVAGTWVRGVSLNRTDHKFTIRLNKAAPKNLKVGWFIVN